MDPSRFDALSRVLAATASRRRLPDLLGGLTLVGALVHLGVPETAAKRKPKKPKLRAVGARCTSRKQCLSGHCGCVGSTCTCRAATCRAVLRPCQTTVQCCSGSCPPIPLGSAPDQCRSATCGPFGSACDDKRDCCLGFCGSAPSGALVCCAASLGEDCFADTPCCGGYCGGDGRCACRANGTPCTGGASTCCSGKCDVSGTGACVP
jgi:hypothetical protein